MSPAAAPAKGHGNLVSAGPLQEILFAIEGQPEGVSAGVGVCMGPEAPTGEPGRWLVAQTVVLGEEAIRKVRRWGLGECPQARPQLHQGGIREPFEEGLYGPADFDR